MSIIDFSKSIDDLSSKDLNVRILNSITKVFDIEIDELIKVRDRINPDIEEAVKIILNSKGKIVITGIGKSGIIGKKIAATLASTGTYSTFINAAEAVHGDLGMIHPEDVVIAISNSGNSDEILNILPSIRKIGVKVIAMTGNKGSKLGQVADYVLNTGVEREACPLNIAPTASTTVMLVMGDAIAIALMELKKFKPEDFALYHPGGNLGKRLLTCVGDVMRKNVALTTPESDMKEVIVEMSEKSLGVVCVLEKGKIIGIITEGDIRRALSNEEIFFSLKAKDIMTENFISVSKDKLAIEALEMMQNRVSEVSVLPVVELGEVIGVVRIHDLVQLK